MKCTDNEISSSLMAEGEIVASFERALKQLEENASI